MNRIVLVVSIMAVIGVVNASAAKELVFTKASKSLSLAQLVDFMMKYADDATIDSPNLSKALGLPGADKGPIPIKGDSTDSGEVGLNKGKAAQLILRNTGQGFTPDSLVLNSQDLFPSEHRATSFDFKFDLTGRLLKAISTAGALDDQGEGVPGTGKINALDITSKKVQAQAQKELEFWRHYTAWELPRKKAAAEAKAKAPDVK